MSVPRDLVAVPSGCEGHLSPLPASLLSSDQSTVLVYVVVILRSEEGTAAYNGVFWEGFDTDLAREDNVCAVAIAVVYGSPESLSYSVPLSRMLQPNGSAGVFDIPQYPGAVQDVDTSSWPRSLSERISSDVAQMAGDELPAERVIVALIADSFEDVVEPDWVSALDAIGADGEVIALNLDSGDGAVSDAGFHVLAPQSGTSEKAAIIAFLSYATRGFSAMPSSSAQAAVDGAQEIAPPIEASLSKSHRAVATAVAERIRQGSDSFGSLALGRDLGSEREAYLGKPSPQRIVGIRSRRIGEQVRLFFRWPDACTGIGIGVENESGSLPSVLLARSTYERDGCWVTIGTSAARVGLTPNYPGDRPEDPKSLETTIAVGPAPPLIKYDVQRFFGHPVAATFVIKSACTVDRLIVVVAQGATMPLTASGGAILVEAENLTFEKGVVDRRPFDQSTVRKTRRPFWIVAFAEVSSTEFALRPYDVRALKFGRG